MARMYYEKDCDLAKLDGKKIGIIGYGSQRSEERRVGKECRL